MLVSRIMPYSGISSNSKNRTNATNSVAFQAEMPRALSAVFLPPHITQATGKLSGDFVRLANVVVAKCQDMYEPVAKAERTLLERIAITETEAQAQTQAIKYAAEAAKLKARITISGKQQPCNAHIERYATRDDLCLDVGEGQEARRYRISLDFSLGNKATDLSQLKVQKPEKGGMFLDWVEIPHDEKVSTMKTLLEAFAGQ